MPKAHTCILPIIIEFFCCAEYWASQGGMQQAHLLLERMRLTKVPSEPYIEAATVEAVYKVTSSLHVNGVLPAKCVIQQCHVATGHHAIAMHSCQCAGQHIMFICSCTCALHHPGLAKAYMHVGRQSWRHANDCHAGSKTAFDITT